MTSDPSTHGESLAEWLRNTIGLRGRITTARLTGGLSNVTLLISSDNGTNVVVRRPPEGQLVGRAHDVLREARIMASFAGSDVPVPEVLATCSDLSVIGVPFFVMSHTVGTPLDTPERANQVPVEDREHVAFQIVDVLASIHRVPPQGEDLRADPDDHPALGRVSRRWLRQWDKVKTRDLPLVESIGSLLQSADIPSVRACVVHGDYRPGNLLFKDGVLTAVLDWELAATGHPLLDLGYIGARMDAPAGAVDGGAEATTIDGFPGFERLSNRYHEVSGQDVSGIDLFIAANAWRWAIIAEGVYRRMRDSSHSTPDALEWHRDRVPMLISFAQERLDRFAQQSA